jgi:hypothetical protein
LDPMSAYDPVGAPLIPKVSCRIGDEIGAIRDMFGRNEPCGLLITTCMYMGKLVS